MRTRTIAGILMIAMGVLLPFAEWQAGVALLDAELERNPVPDQGGMVLVYLGYWLAVAFGVILAVAGLILLLRRPGHHVASA